MNFKKIGLHVPTIMLPQKGQDMNAWAVIACDQYTSQPQYWKDVENMVGDSSSSLKTILPEVYLDNDDEAERINAINLTMQEYIDDEIIVSEKDGFILVDRKTAHTPSRKGLIVALDLEQYDYKKGSKTLIRATEGAIVERLYPRIKIRKNAPLELPHIMVLIDDPKKTVIEPLFKKGLNKVYDFELMMNGGHITGYKIDESDLINEIAENITALTDKQIYSDKYQVSDLDVLLYAMGDGNHSFATAKALWETTKSEAEDKTKIMNHPARYALVELVNLHDSGLVFEPIHRVVFNVSVKDMLDDMASFYSGNKIQFSYNIYETEELFHKAALKLSDDKACQTIPIVTQDGYGLMIFRNPICHLEVETLQQFLDTYLKKNKESIIDYIHGKDVVKSLCVKPDTIGFLLSPIPKNDIFKTIIMDGALPRKSFSMGEAEEKRFYLEAREISMFNSSK